MEFKVGEWYEQWNSVHNCPELPRTLDRMRCIAVDVTELDGNVAFVTQSGDLCWLESDENIKHLPGCDGWDWKPWKPPEPGDGWRLLGVGEVYREGDEYQLDYETNRWMPVSSIGECVEAEELIDPADSDSMWVRRRVPHVKQTVPTGWTQVGGVAGGMLWFAPDDSEPAAVVAPISAQVENTAETELWRELEVGETIREGDECWKHGMGPWVASDVIGSKSGDKYMAKHRRRVRVESPGWRYLDEGETVVAGDESRLTRNMPWHPAASIGDRVATGNDQIFRRKISPG